MGSCAAPGPFRCIASGIPLFQAVADDPDYGVDLSLAQRLSNRIVLSRSDGEVITIPLAPDGTFAMADFVGERFASRHARRAKPFTEQRVWHMGFLLAARHLGVDLDRAQIDLPGGTITIGEGRTLSRGARGPRGVFLHRLVPAPAAPRHCAPLDRSIAGRKSRTTSRATCSGKAVGKQAGGDWLAPPAAMTSPTAGRRRSWLTPCWSANIGMSPIR